MTSFPSFIICRPRDIKSYM